MNATLNDIDELYHRSPCGLLSTSWDDTIAVVNDTLLGWLGYERAEVVGRPFTSLLDAASQVLYETHQRPILDLAGEIREVSLTLLRADGTTLPALVNSVREVTPAGVTVRTAIFDATSRQEYERDLLGARRAAESSESRVRVLQDISIAFGFSVDDSSAAESFATIAREAFSASAVAVMLLDDRGSLELVAGDSPLVGLVAPIPELRDSDRVTVVIADDTDGEFTELAAAMREVAVASLSITPLQNEWERLGVLVCFFDDRGAFDEQFFDLQKALGRQAAQTLVRVRLQRRLEQLALHDQLTGLANRPLLQQSLEEAIDAAERGEHPLAVIFLDLDGFKAINDKLGHAAGDAVLREVAMRLRAGVRMEDTVGRIGGDEFVAICSGVDAESAAPIAERVRASIRHPMTDVPDGLVVSASIGVSLFQPGDARPTVDELLNRADDAMYRAKGSGRDSVSMDSAQKSSM